MLDNFTDGKIDELHLAENKFINTMSQEPGFTLIYYQQSPILRMIFLIIGIIYMNQIQKA